MIRFGLRGEDGAVRLEYAPFPKVIRSGVVRKLRREGLEYAPFPKVIRYRGPRRHPRLGLEYAPFPKVIR